MGLSSPRFSRSRLHDSTVACWPRMDRHGSPGSRWTNANRMIDRPNRTGIAANTRRTVYLNTLACFSRTRVGVGAVRSRPRRLTPSGARRGSRLPGPGRRGPGAAEPLAVEPDGVQVLVEGARADEALDVRASGRRRGRGHERHGRDVGADEILRLLPQRLGSGGVGRRKGVGHRLVELVVLVREL